MMFTREYSTHCVVQAVLADDIHNVTVIAKVDDPKADENNNSITALLNMLYL